jgi:hypothetical protein
MKFLYLSLTCFIFILASIGAACKKNNDSLSQPVIITVTANAGPDRSIVLPRDSVLLTGNAVTIGGSVLSYRWFQKTGPNQGVIISPNTASTLVKGLIAGSYEFEITVTDSNGKIASDSILITVYTTDPCAGCWDY